MTQSETATPEGKTPNSTTEHAPLASARAHLFAPIHGEGLVEQVVRRLGEAIGLGVLEVGERLPSASNLAKQFEIAPMTLREALAILREAGYVETRRGRGGGTFVRRSIPSRSTRKIHERLNALSVEDLHDLMNFRMAVEGANAELAAERAETSDVDELRSLVDRMAPPPKFSVFRQLDIRFHLAIASVAKSPRLVAAETSIQADWNEFLMLIPHPPQALRVSNEQHRAIVRAISRGNRKAARARTEEHVRGTADFLIGLRLGKVR